MNTFLPYDSFEHSAKALDNKRLWNQINECKVILKTLLGMYEKGWVHHPAVKMWKKYEHSLCRYAIACCEEYKQRELRIPNVGFFQELLYTLNNNGNPPWFGGKIHASHRSNLLRKDPEWYGQFNWKEKPGLSYVWPEIV